MYFITYVCVQILVRISSVLTNEFHQQCFCTTVYVGVHVYELCGNCYISIYLYISIFVQLSGHYHTVWVFAWLAAVGPVNSGVIGRGLPLPAYWACQLKAAGCIAWPEYSAAHIQIYPVRSLCSASTTQQCRLTALWLARSLTPCFTVDLFFIGRILWLTTLLPLAGSLPWRRSLQPTSEPLCCACSLLLLPAEKIPCSWTLV